MGRTARTVVVIVVAGTALAACASQFAAESHRPGSSIRDNALLETVDSVRQERGALGALAVLVSDGQRREFTSGTADAAESPVSIDMRFRIGSITKPIVAALALDQVDQAVLSLDRDINDLVGPPLRGSPAVTLRNLLNHTSGVFDIGNEGDAIADVEKLTDAELLEEVEALYAGAADGQPVVASDRLIIGLAETHDRYFDPGTGHHYSNTNYQIIGRALTEVTGRPLAELLEARITGPLGLTDTSLAPDDRGTPEFHGYVTDIATGEEVDVSDDLLAFGNGAGGGIVSTASDLLTIMTELVHGSVLPGDLQIRMQTPTRQSGGTYGLGMALYELSCGRFYGHEGRVNGTVSIALVDADRPDHALVAAFNSTDDQTGLGAFGEQLLCSAGVAPIDSGGG